MQRGRSTDNAVDIKVEFSAFASRRGAGGVTTMLSKVLCVSILLFLSGCPCLGHRNARLADFNFSVLHPHEVVVYKPVGGAAPANDRIFIYLALQNDDTKGRPLCFCKSDGEQFKRGFFSPGHKL